MQVMVPTPDPTGTTACRERLLGTLAQALALPSASERLEQISVDDDDKDALQDIARWTPDDDILEAGTLTQYCVGLRHTPWLQTSLLRKVCWMLAATWSPSHRGGAYRDLLREFVFAVRARPAVLSRLGDEGCQKFATHLRELTLLEMREVVAIEHGDLWVRPYGTLGYLFGVIDQLHDRWLHDLDQGKARCLISWCLSLVTHDDQNPVFLDRPPSMPWDLFGHELGWLPANLESMQRFLVPEFLARWLREAINLLPSEEHWLVHETLLLLERGAPVFKSRRHDVLRNLQAAGDGCWSQAYGMVQLDAEGP
jgi:hypothetical protein